MKLEALGSPPTGIYMDEVRATLPSCLGTKTKVLPISLSLSLPIIAFGYKTKSVSSLVVLPLLKLLTTPSLVSSTCLVLILRVTIIFGASKSGKENQTPTVFLHVEILIVLLLFFFAAKYYCLFIYRLKSL